MRTYAFLFALLLVIAACKKQSGKHCPLITETNLGHRVDLAPVAWIPKIMDTLNKYPQLQVYDLHFSWGHDPGSYSANVRCNIYHKGVLIFDKGYYLYASTYGNDTAFNKSRIPDITTSEVPSLSLEEANDIADKKVHFEHCTTSRLGFLNKGSGIIPDYKLVWRIRAVEDGYPWADIDAQTGEVIYYSERTTTDGLLID